MRDRVWVTKQLKPTATYSLIFKQQAKSNKQKNTNWRRSSYSTIWCESLGNMATASFSINWQTGLLLTDHYHTELDITAIVYFQYNCYAPIKQRCLALLTLKNTNVCFPYSYCWQYEEKKRTRSRFVYLNGRQWKLLRVGQSQDQFGLRPSNSTIGGCTFQLIKYGIRARGVPFCFGPCIN